MFDWQHPNYDRKLHVEKYRLPHLTSFWYSKRILYQDPSPPYVYTGKCDESNGQFNTPQQLDINMSNSDVNILRGYGALINPENISPDVDVREIERSMIDAGIYSPPTADPTDKFLEEMNKTASKLGINFDVAGQKTGGSTHDSYRSSDRPSSPQNESRDSSSYPSSSYPSSSSSYPSSSYPSSYPSSSTQYPADDNSDESDDEPAPSYSDNFRGYTQEQERRTQINNVFGKSEPQFSIDAEKREDMKCAMLAEIDSIRSVLEGEDIDLTRIPEVNQSSTYETVESVLKILRHKNDHASCCGMATELVMFGAYGLEELFDGKTTYFGRYQPDLTDWSTVVQTKLRRMRHTTGQVVSEVMQTVGVGPGMRIMLELVPSMLTHSYNRKKIASEGDMFNDASMSHSTRNLRGMGQ